MKIIKEYKGLLTHWDDVLTSFLKNQKSQPTFGLRSVDDFIDGFELQSFKNLGIR